MTPPDRITLWCAAQSAPEAVAQAKARALADGWRLVPSPQHPEGVVRVEYRPATGSPAWDVTLEVGL
jgi:hypothetical protein